MRTLSARILLGFAALTLTFGAIAATVVVNMLRVEDEIHQVREGYLSLALISKDLAHAEDLLAKYLDQAFEANPPGLGYLRNTRDRALVALRTQLTLTSESIQDRNRKDLE